MFVCVSAYVPSGEGVGAEEPAAVTIASAQQAAVFAADHNVQYQFRTENSGGQVSTAFKVSGGGATFAGVRTRSCLNHGA